MDAPAPPVSTMSGGSLSVSPRVSHAHVGDESWQQSGPHEGGSFRRQAPGRIPLSPMRLNPGLLASPSPHISPMVPSSHGSPPLPLANELPDDPAQASQLVHLYAPPLAPAWSPAPSPMPRSHSGRMDDPVLSHGPSGGAQHARPPNLPSPVLSDQGLHRPLSSPRSPQTLLSPHLRHRGLPKSPEPNIFERDIELCGSPHLRTPQEAIDTSVPTVLEGAADAIVGDSTLEIVAPRDELPPASPHASPDVRGRRWLRGEPLLRGASQDGLTPRTIRSHGHRRLHSEHTNVITSLPGMPSSPSRFSPTGSRRSTLLAPGTPMSRTDSLAPSMSPSVSIDGAIIPEGQAATVAHSLDGLADVIVHPTPEGQAMPTASPAPMDTMPASTSYFSLPSAAEEPRPSSKFRYTLLDTPPSATASPNLERSHSMRNGRPPSFYMGTSARQPLSSRRPRSADSSTGESLAPPLVHVSPESTGPDVAASSTGSSGERKRLSWMAYADLVRDADEQVTDVDPHVHLR